MAESSRSGIRLGINGLGRIGKLTLWQHVARKFFGEIVVNRFSSKSTRPPTRIIFARRRFSTVPMRTPTSC